jgi:hypothetical protein
LAAPERADDALPAAQSDADTVTVERLTPKALAPLVEQAVAAWSTAPLSTEQADALAQVDFLIVDLPGPILAQVSGTTIAFDANAARHGWFVDPTPAANEEFDTAVAAGLLASTGSPAADRMDVLTAALHELGHVLGFPDDFTDAESDGIMNAWLDKGLRRELPDDAWDQLFTDLD